MKKAAKDLIEGDKFIWTGNGAHPYTSPPSLIIAKPLMNERNEVTFPVLYLEPTDSSGDYYDVFSLSPDDEVNIIKD